MPDFNAPVLIVVGIVAVLLIIGSFFARSLVRRFVIRMAETFGVLSIMIGAITGGLSGYGYGRLLRLEFDAVEQLPLLGAIVGTIGGFVIPAIIFSFLFLMIDIAENTKRMVAVFQHIQTNEKSS